MNSHDDAAYRLELAQGYLERAEGDSRERRWDDCLANAQSAVENAGKSILLQFRPIPATHDVDDLLQKLFDRENVPRSVQDRLRGSLDAFRDMGTKTHIRAAYGDEATRTPPWKLITEAEAAGALGKARRAVALANAIDREMNKPANERE